MADPTTIVRIPAPLVGPLSTVAAMEDEQFAELVDALHNYEGTGPDELYTYLIDRLRHEPPIAAGIVSLILSFETLRESNEWSPERAATEIANANGSPATTDEERSALAGRFRQLLGISSITLAAKIGDVVASNERTWRSAQFLTDMRVVEGTDAVGGVVITTLEVSYFDSDGRTKRTYFTLDDDDLDQIAEALGEARQRSNSLRERLRDAGIRVAATTQMGPPESSGLR
jgi:hypothetical protein